MNAVWTTLGCCAAAAAPIAGTEPPFIPLLSSPCVFWMPPFLSATGLLRIGGPMTGSVDGVMSMASRGGVRVEDPDEDGRIGMALCIP